MWPHCSVWREQQVDNSSRPAQELPWFGAVEGWALLPPKGAATASEDPVAILVLAQVHVLSA